jgi:hypothetical protein
MLQSGVQLLDRFAQDDRIRIRQPRRNLQIKFTQISGRRTSSIAAPGSVASPDPVAEGGVFARSFLTLNPWYCRASQFACQPPSLPFATAACPDKIDSFESGNQSWRS